MMIKNTFCLLALTFLLTSSGLVAAQDAILWTDLSYEERQLLQLNQIQENQWNNFSVDRQQRIRRGVSRFEQMQPAERARAITQQRRFQNLNRQQQQQVVQRFQQFNALSGEQQRRLRQFQRRFQSLPPAQQRELRQRYQQQINQLQRERQIQENATRDLRQSQRRAQRILQEVEPALDANTPVRDNNN